ncbi:GGDEF domain-containing protein [Spirilliplanes yamanashiensis]|uniref:GGDEF domain-containing protein n=1 Tax=Spirilliplanes yamanashiensis TaxID=42233 RepID=A0A8J3YD35_9ACTN|nr:GGDEF domain-containing protein [Spirilliplanes yamanashiensis]MDP9819098.1 diguanylate cyclase (GGDEF)-like protein [Spirilliplanes yamanashiensis]GIJ05552.1 hypothetical protein Sya03_49040 [Spirilliplanes yamanashiensis]
MRADADPDAARASVPRRVRTVRVSSVRALLGPAVAAVYLLCTPGRPDRPVMLAITAVMLAVAVGTWSAASWLARSRARVAVQAAGMVVNIAGSSALSLLDGGVASPLGALVPFTLLFYAIMMPPRMFAVASLLSAAGYGVVAVAGGPAPTGYAAVYALGIGGVAYLCFRHAAVLASLRHRLKEASRLDPLTRVLNRRGFDERLDRAVADAARTGRPLTLVLTDLDHFKAVNDRYGHQAGDDVLAWTARTMTRALRRRDVLGRLGGDEFGVLLDGAGPAEAPALVDRLRRAVRGAAPGSFGYASYPAEAATVDDLRRLADERSYADKVGRRRTVPAAPDVAHARANADRPHTGVTAGERRRRSIADMGRLAASDCAVGLVWAVALASGQPHRLAIAALCVAGLAYGGILILASDRLSRSAAARDAMVASAVFLFALAIVVPVLGGGVAGALGIGMLAPMPLVALGVPRRLALPIIAAQSVAYLVVAGAVGDPDPWYVLLHLFGMLAVAVACARQGASAAAQRRLLTRLSQTDALTGVLNRRGFADRFAAESARPGRPLGLVVFDLNGFKRVNDTAGHAAGDDLLRWVATTATAVAGPDAAVCRLGGDEFVVLLRADPAALAGRLRDALAARAPISAGVAVLGRDGTDFATLYAHADAALYREKHGARPVLQRLS